MVVCDETQKRMHEAKYSFLKDSLAGNRVFWHDICTLTGQVRKDVAKSQSE